MLALYATGRQQEALDEYHRVRRRLDEELGIEPGPELEEAHLAVLQQTAPRAIAPTSGQGGEVDLSLIGRDEDYRALEELYHSGVRLITLVGPGGIGKTSLCRAVMASLRRRTAGIVAFVELETVQRASDVPASVAAALGGDADPAALIGDDEAWCALDNVEQVVDVAPWIGAWLNACPNLRLLATSREPLGVRQEHVYQLASLAQEAARELFMARGRKVRPDIEPSPVIDQICASVDRLPLAIELAAARVNLMSPETLLGKLDHALDVLGADRRDRPDRQRTMRTTISWSHALLDDESRMLFERLAIFVGGFRLDAAELVCGGTVESMGRLLAQSLIAARYGESEPRFHMLETIRAYAMEQLLANGELELTQRAHAAWALDLVRSVDHSIASADVPSILLLASELDNISTAMEWTRQSGDDAARFEIAVGLSDVWQTRGLLAEARRWLEPDLDGADIPDELRLDVLHTASAVALRQGRLADLEILSQEQLALAERLGRPDRMVSALAKLAQIAVRSGDIEGARKLHDRAIAMAQERRDDRSLLVSLTSQGNADLVAGRADLAVTAFERALQIALEIGRPESVATAYFNAGLAMLEAGASSPEARASLWQALDRYCALDDIEGVGYVLVAGAYGLSENEPRAAAIALGASNAALSAVGAQLEAAEARARQITVGRLQAKLAADLLDQLLAEESGTDLESWIGVASDTLSRLEGQST